LILLNKFDSIALTPNSIALAKACESALPWLLITIPLTPKKIPPL
jgi:hypothetical protein